MKRWYVAAKDPYGVWRPVGVAPTGDRTQYGRAEVLGVDYVDGKGTELGFATEADALLFARLLQTSEVLEPWRAVETQIHCEEHLHTLEDLKARLTRMGRKVEVAGARAGEEARRERRTG